MKLPWISQGPDGNIKAEEWQLTRHGVNYVTIEPRCGDVVASNVAEESEVHQRLRKAAREHLWRTPKSECQ